MIASGANSWSHMTFSAFVHNKGLGKVADDYTLTDEIIEARQKQEEQRRMRRLKEDNSDCAEFFLRYAKVRHAQGENGAIVNAKLLDNTKDEHILSDADSGQIENKENAETKERAEMLLLAMAGLIAVRGRELSGEQIAEIAAEYDLSNLSRDQAAKLLGKLAELGALNPAQRDMAAELVASLPDSFDLVTAVRARLLEQNNAYTSVLEPQEDKTVSGRDLEWMKSLSANVTLWKDLEHTLSQLC